MTRSPDRDRLQASELSAGVLFQITLIDFVCGSLVAVGELRLAAVSMWGLVGLALLRLIILRRSAEAASLLIGLAPMMSLLRAVIFYSGMPILYMAAAAWVAWNNSSGAKQLFGRPSLPGCLVLLTVGYFLLSVIITADLRQNFRVFELTGAAMLVCFLSFRRELLLTAVAGVLISALAVGCGAYPHVSSVADERLGIIAIDGMYIGNPFGLGTPLALGVLALTIDRGSWTGLARHPVFRLFLLLPTVVLLALSTSRAGWLITACGLVAGVAVSRRQRFRLFFAIMMVIVAGVALSATPLAEPFMRGWNRTFGEGRDMSKASSGRADQWRVFLYAFLDSPNFFVAGHGPGSGPSVFADCSPRVPGIQRTTGRREDFHALIMHIGTEFGLLGLCPLLAWLALAVRNSIATYFRTRLVLPPVCLMCFIIVSLTVRGFDTVTGTFLGLSLIVPQVLPRVARSRGYSPKYRLPASPI